MIRDTALIALGLIAIGLLTRAVRDLRWIRQTAPTNESPVTLAAFTARVNVNKKPPVSWR